MTENTFDVLNGAMETAEEAENLKSLLENPSNEESLLNTEYNTDTTLPLTDDELVEAHNERVAMSAEYKANIILMQYVSQARDEGRFISGHDKRMLYKKFLRRAKKGKYDYMFDPEKIAKRQERMKAKSKAKFELLNSPIIKHTVEEIPDNVQERLKEMVNETPWNELKPENYK